MVSDNESAFHSSASVLVVDEEEEEEENKYEYDDVIFLLDECMRSPHTPLSIFLSPHDRDLYLETDLQILLEYSRTRFEPFLDEFQHPYLLRKIRMVTFFLTVKQYTDVILLKPFSYAWTVTVGAGNLPFLESCERFVETMIKMEPYIFHVKMNA